MKTVRTRASAITAATIVAMLAVAFTPLAPGASAHAPGGNAHATLTETSTCRASVLRVTAPIIGTLEPVFVQNTAGQPCTNKSAALISPIGIPGVLLLSVGQAAAQVSGNVNHPNPAGVLVAGLTVGVPGVAAISAGVISSTARALQCSGPFGLPTSRPTLTSGGAIVNLTIAGNTTPIIDTPVDIPLPPLAVLSLNKTTTTASEITRQALRLTVPLLGIDVVIAETKAGWLGNPCDGHT